MQWYVTFLLVPSQNYVWPCIYPVRAASKPVRTSHTIVHTLILVIRQPLPPTCAGGSQLCHHWLSCGFTLEAETMSPVAVYIKPPGYASEPMLSDLRFQGICSKLENPSCFSWIRYSFLSGSSGIPTFLGAATRKTLVHCTYSRIHYNKRLENMNLTLTVPAAHSKELISVYQTPCPKVVVILGPM